MLAADAANYYDDGLEELFCSSWLCLQYIDRQAYYVPHHITSCLQLNDWMQQQPM